MKKTNGQILYEYKFREVPVVQWEKRLFATEADIKYMLVYQPPWELLTEKCHQEWEQLAEGHYLFTSMRIDD